MASFLKKVKVRINFWLDRILEECNQSMMGAGNLSAFCGLSFANVILRFFGDICLLLKNFPRISVYRFQGKHWNIIFIGNKQYLIEIPSIFFKNETIQPELIDKIALWDIKKKSRAFLKEDTDLVICESYRLFPLKFSSKIVFSYPCRINQEVTIPEKLENFLAGPVLERKRKQINKANRFSTGWYYTQAEEDYKLFHYKMYRPFISSRHNNQAKLTNYEDQHKNWLRKGGLVMVTENGEPIAGLICVKAGNVMYAIEAGILLYKYEEAKYSIFTYLLWAGIQWAHQKKAKIYDLGGCKAFLSDPAFRSKSHWNSKVVRQPRAFLNYTCLAENISPGLREHINKLGFITEVHRKFYRVYLSEDNQVSFEEDPHLYICQ